MLKLSRRQLAKYAVDQVTAGASVKELAERLSSVLFSTKRSNQGPQLMEDIRYELEARGVAVQAIVTTAHPLSEELNSQLNKLIKQSSKVETVRLSKVIDESVIGGIRIDTASRSWDQTIKRRLTDIREAF